LGLLYCLCGSNHRYRLSRRQAERCLIDKRAQFRETSRQCLTLPLNARNLAINMSEGYRRISGFKLTDMGPQLNLNTLIPPTLLLARECCQPRVDAGALPLNRVTVQRNLVGHALNARLVVSRDTLEDMARRRIPPRSQRCQPTLVLPALLKQRRNLV
jgi:hypothetical protein